MPPIFISHASVDQPLVDEFIATVLQLGLNLNSDHYFYSSDPDAGIPAGRDGNAHMRERAREAKLVICMITPAYAQSQFCLAELGGAWASVAEDAMLPITLPSLAHSDLGGVLRGVQVLSLDDPVGLNLLRDRVINATGVQSKVTGWERARQRWLKALPDLASSVGQPAEEMKLRDSWGHLFDTLVDAALYMETEHVARAQIMQHIETDTVIPSRYHYSSDACAANWISRCKDPQYRHQRHTTEFWSSAAGKRFADIARESIGGDAFDFVSLGPGDGEKDADLVFNWLEHGIDLLYYPYDVSLPLTARAVQTVRARAQSRSTKGSLRMKAVLADFQHLDKVQQVFQHRSTPNVVGLMGTMGNLKSDLGFLNQLSRVMSSGDLLMLEVRLASDAKVNQLVSDSSLRHDFGPLEHHLGMKFQQAKVKPTEEFGVSSIPGTKTIVVTYNGTVQGSRAKRVTLQYIHLYDPDAFLAAVKQTGFDVVHTEVERDKAFLECLLRHR